MKQRNIRLRVLIVFLALAGGYWFWSKKTSAGPVIARVNDYQITLSQVVGQMEKLPTSYKENLSKDLLGFVEKIIADELLYQKAREMKLHKDPDVKETYAQAKKKILIARLIKDKIDDRVSVTKEDVESYYTEHISEFRHPTMLRASHILVSDLEIAKQILEEIKKGDEEFSFLAMTRSEDSSAKRGGDIGFFASGQLIPEFEEICQALKLGEISGVVKTRFGYHIIKLTGIKAEEEIPLEELSGRIERMLRKKKRKSMYTNFLQTLKKTSRISINKENLKMILKPGDRALETEK